MGRGWHSEHQGEAQVLLRARAGPPGSSGWAQVCTSPGSSFSLVLAQVVLPLHNRVCDLGQVDTLRNYLIVLVSSSVN